MNGSISRRSFLALVLLGGLWPFSLFRRKPKIAGITFDAIRRGRDRRRYIWIHGNEPTARAVLAEHMRHTDGRAFLIESTERNVAVGSGKLDPNRMFSRVGASKNLHALNPDWTETEIMRVLSRLDRERERFLRSILPEQGELLVALHNNGPGYSVNDELSISDAVSLNDASHPDEFLLCTMAADYERLSKGPFNVILQHRTPLEDDGSLSRLCAARNIRYVNIEAAHGNSAGQSRILQWLEQTLL